MELPKNGHWAKIGWLLTAITVVGGYLYVYSLKGDNKAIRGDIGNLRASIVTASDREKERDDRWIVEDAEQYVLRDEFQGETLRRIQDIRLENEAQTVILAEIVATLAQQFAQRESRFEELEIGQRVLLEALGRNQYNLGVHQGSHDQLEHLLQDLQEALE